jgi:hypothetical protein
VSALAAWVGVHRVRAAVLVSLVAWTGAVVWREVLVTQAGPRILPTPIAALLLFAVIQGCVIALAVTPPLLDVRRPLRVVGYRVVWAASVTAVVTLLSSIVGVLDGAAAGASAIARNTLLCGALALLGSAMLGLERSWLPPLLATLATVQWGGGGTPQGFATWAVLIDPRTTHLQWAVVTTFWLAAAVVIAAGTGWPRSGVRVLRFRRVAVGLPQHRR